MAKANKSTTVDTTAPVAEETATETTQETVDTPAVPEAEAAPAETPAAPVEEAKETMEAEPARKSPQSPRARRRQMQEEVEAKSSLRKVTRTVFSTDTKVITDADAAPEITFEELILRKYGATLENLSEDAAAIIRFIDRYQNIMGQRDVVEETGISLQRQLFKTYLKIMILPQISERNVVIEYLLWKFNDKSSNAFTPVMLARYTRRGNWDIAELLMFNSLNSIFDKIKEPKTRIAQLQSIRLGEILQRYPADKSIYVDGLISWTQSMR